VDFNGISGRELRNEESHCIPAIELKLINIVLGAKLRPPDVFQSYQRAVIVDLKYDVFELVRLGEPPDGTHADLKILSRSDGKLAHLAGGHFDVLFLQSADR